ncbi:MAG: hypothetical protein KAS62_02445, partial [Candidatus Delongbacteria bacterium]|nr:hypothetical protein [Candidatus Delongbacteria bacterium]
FSDMAVNVISDKPFTLIDSRIYIKENNSDLLEESGINIIASLDFNVHNNVIANFDYGISTPLKKGKFSKGRITNNTITFDATPTNKSGEKKGIVVNAVDSLEIDDNEIVNPDEGIGAVQSSGRITNNTITFDATPTNKADAPLKKGIYIVGSNFEITGNTIISNDISTPSISGIEVENSSVSASYNVIDFAKYNNKDCVYYGFFTTALGPNSQFINNTINNATFGFYNEGAADPTDFINNLVWGDGVLPGNVTSNSDILLAYNNDILGEKSGLLEDKDNFKEDPLYKSVKISDFYLDSKSKCIDVGMEVKDFHVYGENFFGDAPDVGALEFYVAIVVNLDSPSNVSIS